jgi:hypothetical protein
MVRRFASVGPKRSVTLCTTAACGLLLVDEPFEPLPPPVDEDDGVGVTGMSAEGDDDVPALLDVPVPEETGVGVPAEVLAAVVPDVVVVVVVALLAVEAVVVVPLAAVAPELPPANGLRVTLLVARAAGADVSRRTCAPWPAAPAAPPCGATGAEASCPPRINTTGTAIIATTRMAAMGQSRFSTRSRTRFSKKGFIRLLLRHWRWRWTLRARRPWRLSRSPTATTCR